MKNTQWDENEINEINPFEMDDPHSEFNKGMKTPEETPLSNAEITDLRRRVEDRLESRRLGYVGCDSDYSDSYWEDSRLD